MLNLVLEVIKSLYNFALQLVIIHALMCLVAWLFECVNFDLSSFFFSKKDRQVVLNLLSNIFTALVLLSLFVRMLI